MTTLRDCMPIDRLNPLEYYNVLPYTLQALYASTATYLWLLDFQHKALKSLPLHCWLPLFRHCNTPQIPTHRHACLPNPNKKPPQPECNHTAMISHPLSLTPKVGC